MGARALVKVRLFQTDRQRLSIIRRLTCLGVLISTVANANAASAQLTKTINFSERPAPETLSWGGVEVTVQPRSENDNLIEMMASVRAPGFQSIIVSDDVVAQPGFDRWVGIGKLSRSDSVPSVLLAGFTGGAHCCAALTAIVPDADKLKVVRFPEIDGAPDEAFPVDIDGDGTVDFVRQDDSFRYQFASGAGSWSPLVFLNIYKGQIVDVSDQPSFRKQWESFAAKTRAACRDTHNDDRNGALASPATT